MRLSCETMIGEIGLLVIGCSRNLRYYINVEG